MGTISQPELGLIIIALSLTSYFLGVFRTLASAGIFTGILLVGLSGRVITLVAKLEGVGLALAGHVGATVFGVTAGTVVAVITVVTTFILLHDMAPRNSTKKRTFWLAAMLAVAIVASITPFAALNNLPGTVQSTVTSVQGG